MAEERSDEGSSFWSFFKLSEKDSSLREVMTRRFETAPYFVGWQKAGLEVICPPELCRLILKCTRCSGQVRELSSRLSPADRARRSSVFFPVDLLAIELQEIDIHWEAARGRRIEDKAFAQPLTQGVGIILLGVLHNGFAFLS